MFRLGCIGFVFVSVALTTPARADNARCRATLAEARSRADLLYAPRVSVQGLHAPGGNDADATGTFYGDGYQIRASGAWSPLDVYRGALVVRTARAECRRGNALERLDDVVGQGVLFGRLEALRTQAEFLARALPEVEALVHTAEQRLERHVVTFMQVDELRRRHLGMRRALLEARGEIALLEDRGADETDDISLDTELAAYERHSRAAERTGSTFRKTAAWRMDLRAGVAPLPDGTDWFGVVEVSYNLGGILQGSHEREYLEARTDELRNARTEARYRVTRFRAAMRDSVEQLTAELALIDDELAILESGLARIEHRDDPATDHRRAIAISDRYALSAQRVFVAALLAARKAVLQ